MKNLTINDDVILCPVPRAKLKDLRGLLIKILAAWLSNEFATGDTIADAKTWGLMKKVIAMLPRDGGGEWDDIDQFANDYEWIEKVFFAKEKGVGVKDINGIKNWHFDLTAYRPGAIVEIHYLDHMRLLREADEFRLKAE